MNRVSRYLGLRDVCLDMDIADKRSLFEAVGRHMHAEHSLSANEVVQGLWRREQAGPTGIGEGVAIPHARIAGLEHILAYYARLRSPLAFSTPDDRPVCDVLVLLVPKQAAKEHLELLADATQMFALRRFRERLHLCTRREQVLALFSGRIDAASA